MESFKVENLSFTYPDREDMVLNNINFTVKQGEFVLICGKSGCGKTTLLRLLKPFLSPVGKMTGSISFNGKNYTFTFNFYLNLKCFCTFAKGLVGAVFCILP